MPGAVQHPKEFQRDTSSKALGMSLLFEGLGSDGLQVAGVLERPRVTTNRVPGRIR